MLTERNLKELLEYKAGSPVLSIYLNTDPTTGNSDAYKLQLRNMLKEVDQEEDANLIERYFQREFDWRGRSVAVFSCAPENFFRAYSLAVPVRSRVRVSERPYFKPLADLLDSYGGYGVVLVDKQGARLFYFHLGELREQEGMLGETVRHTKRGGGSQALGRRGGTAGMSDRSEEVTERNLKEAADFAAGFFNENNVRRVLIGGTEDIVKRFQSMLPKAWQSLVVGTFAMSMNAGHAEILEKALQVGREADNRREIRLIEAVITGAAKGRGGVARLEDTLRAIHEGRVHTLLFREGLKTSGGRCDGCGFVSASLEGECPYCSGSLVEIPDAIEVAVRRVIRSGGDVEVIHEDHDLAEYEHIGALTRY